MHSRDGKAAYINRYIAPWSFGRNEFQKEIDELSSRFGERAREMRLSQREGVANAIIALWGDLQLEQLDADSVSILASGESPRKGLLVDYMGNLKRSAQLGLPIYRLGGGAGYLWSAAVDRDRRGHIRFLAVDPSALAPSTVLAAASDEFERMETPATEKADQLAVASLGAASVEAEKAKAGAEPARGAMRRPAALRAEKTKRLMARLQADAAAAEAKSRAMETLAYRAIGSLIALPMIAALVLLAWRKRRNAARRQADKSEPKLLAATQPRAGQVQSAGWEGAPLQRQSFAETEGVPPRPRLVRPAATRRGTRQEAALALLERPEGATVADIMKATGWQQQSVRSFFARVVRRKLGLTLISEKTDGRRIYRVAARQAQQIESEPLQAINGLTMLAKDTPAMERGLDDAGHYSAEPYGTSR
jgi:hypothetical protein